MSSENPQLENLRTVYRELCSSYRAIDDFRTKLLGFLPLATGTGIFFLLTDNEKLEGVKQYFRPIGTFGFAITVGLFFYEFYGIKKCTSLIGAGMELEKHLHVKDGQFSKRPHGVLGFINEPLAAGVIYPAVLAAWTFIAFSPSQNAEWWATRVFLIGLGISFLYNLKLILESLRKTRRAK